MMTPNQRRLAELLDLRARMQQSQVEQRNHEQPAVRGENEELAPVAGGLQRGFDPDPLERARRRLSEQE